MQILPPPFAWVTIPEQGYSISRYPITNTQFARFVNTGGYHQQRWWTEIGWRWREKENWTEPRFWQDSKWNGADYPVVGVSWYEAVAFCLWLSETTDESISLPTYDQWVYAANGGDPKRLYPWGNKWDRLRCNNGVGWVFNLFRRADVPGHATHTTPVTAYEGKGDSPFGVVDMIGNVWEFTLTDYVKKTNDIHTESRYRVRSGGSWHDSETTHFVCRSREWVFENVGYITFGFRPVRLD